MAIWGEYCFSAPSLPKGITVENLRKISDRQTRIVVCNYNGDSIYLLSQNSIHAGSHILNKDLKIIGTCNYAFRIVDEICKKVNFDDCKVVYNPAGAITDIPYLDLYGLDK